MNLDGLLPIKVVFPKKDRDYRPNNPGGGSSTEFVPVTRDLRESLNEQVKGVAEYFNQAFRLSADVPAVARVRLRPQAIAKSHRPTDLFTPDTCPIIGGNDAGELFVSVRPRGLARLNAAIDENETDYMKANISTIQEIEPYRSDDALANARLDTAARQADEASVTAKVRLFNHLTASDNDAVEREFRRIAQEGDIARVEAMNYAEGLRLYRVTSNATELLSRLANFVGVQSVSAFPEFRVVKTASRQLFDITAAHFPPPIPGRDYPLVGIIDTGTDPQNTLLSAWVAERYVRVPEELQDNSHGSFVAGLVVHGRRLNHDHEDFPSASSRIIDVVAIDKAGSITEDQLYSIIEEALEKFRNVKIWNLSLSQSEPCGNSTFSDFAAFLDSRSKEFGVQFVIAAGNYETTPLRGWPPCTEIGEADRICPPADSLRGITVGSVAHIGTNTTCVNSGEPSPFSRRGPGPAYTNKPEVAMVGGNCDSQGNRAQTGVISIDGGGHIAEDIGTSFACPLVASLMANIFSELEADPKGASVALAKALMIHSAFVANPLPDRRQINYMGMGRPPDLSTILNCRQSSATVIFEVPVRSRLKFMKTDFPMPRCLQTEMGLKAEVFMTLLYEPPLDQSRGSEYCRCNVRASLGTVTKNKKDGKPQYTGEVPPFPDGITEGMEQTLVEFGYKWSPLKFYYRKFDRGPADKEWRLSLDLLNRAGEMFLEQDAILVVTIRDPDRESKKGVYNELTRRMDMLRWDANDLHIKSRSRLYPR